MKVKQAYEIQEALEVAECKETDEHERMINVKWVNLKEIRKVVAAFDFGDLELNREQCNAFRAFFNELCDIEFRPYLRCVRPSEACTSGCGFLEKCQKLNPKLDLASYGNKPTEKAQP